MDDNFEPMTDPFRRLDPTNIEENTSIPNSTTNTVNEKENDHDKIKRGMPKKGLINGAIVVLGIGFVAFMMFPQDNKQKKINTAPVQIEKTAESTPAQVSNVISGLNNDALKLKKNEDDNNNNKSYINNNVGNNDGKGFNEKSALNSITEPNSQKLTLSESIQAKKESIIASSMDASDVNVTENQSKTADKQAVEKPESLSAKLLRESLGQQGELLKSLSGNNDQNHPKVSVSDPNQTFLNNMANAESKPFETLKQSPPSFSLFEGTIINAATANAISTELPGMVRARITNDVYDSATLKHLLIPRGSIIIMAYKSSILVGQSRILMAGSRLIFPNGKSFNLLGAPAGDLLGMSGVPAEIDNHFYEMFKYSFIIGAASLFLSNDKQQSTQTQGVNGTQTGGTVISAALLDVITRIAQRNSNIGPTATLLAGEPISFFLSRDVALEPYLWDR